MTLNSRHITPPAQYLTVCEGIVALAYTIGGG
jgi:hypothetical protein